jgi:hypothetical protein
MSGHPTNVEFREEAALIAFTDVTATFSPDGYPRELRRAVIAVLVGTAI